MTDPNMLFAAELGLLGLGFAIGAWVLVSVWRDERAREYYRVIDALQVIDYCQTVPDLARITGLTPRRVAAIMSRALREGRVTHAGGWYRYRWLTAPGGRS